MAEFVDLTDKIKRYYRFNKFETRGFAIAILVVAFIVSFRNWGSVHFNFGEGLSNLIQAIIIVAFSVLIHDAGQRIWGLAIGYKIEFKMWTFGLLAALAAAFLTNGKVWLILPGGFLIHHLAGHRLGFFRYGINYFGQAMVALAGPLFTLMLIIILKTSNAIVPSAFLEKAILFNIVYLITSLIPIPPLDGSKMFFGSRIAYAFLMPALIVAAIMLMINIPVVLALIVSMLVAMVLWIVYYISFERKVWFGPK